MRKIKKSSELLWVLGVLFVALGVAVCSKANLGVSMIAAPAFVVSEALSPLWEGLSVGMTEYIIQGILLVVLCIVVRRFGRSYPASFIVAIIYGYALDLAMLILANVSFDELWLRWLMLFVGDALTAFGVACFFRTYLPLQVYELFVAEVSDRFGLNINRTKWVFDISLLAVSVTLALTLFGDAGELSFSNFFSSDYHSIGPGTLVTTAINSPLIALAGRLIDRFFEPTPLFPKVSIFLKRN